MTSTMTVADMKLGCILNIEMLADRWNFSRSAKDEADLDENVNLYLAKFWNADRELTEVAREWQSDRSFRHLFIGRLVKAAKGAARS